MKGLIKLKSNRKVFQCLLKDAKASKGSASSQMKLPSGFLLLSYSNVKVLQGFIKVVKLEIKQPSKEEQAWLKLLFAAATDGNGHEL